MDAESSKELLLKARAGDAAALDHLFRRYRASLQRWAHGRLPAGRATLPTPRIFFRKR